MTERPIGDPEIITQPTRETLSQFGRVAHQLTFKVERAERIRPEPSSPGYSYWNLILAGQITNLSKTLPLHPTFTLSDLVASQYKLLVPTNETILLPDNTHMRIVRGEFAIKSPVVSPQIDKLHRSKSFEDKEGNQLLLTRLVLGEDTVGLDPITLAERLRAENSPHEVNYGYLRNAVAVVSSDTFVKNLMKLGLVNSEDLTAFYERLRDWMVFFADEESVFSRQSTRWTRKIFPYPAGADPKFYPPVSFLPYILEAYRDFIFDIAPLVDRPGYFGRIDVITYAHRLYSDPDSFVNKVLAASKDASEEDISVAQARMGSIRGEISVILANLKTARESVEVTEVENFLDRRLSEIGGYDAADKRKRRNLGIRLARRFRERGGNI